MKKRLVFMIITLCMCAASLVGCKAPEEAEQIVDENLVVSMVSDSTEENILAEDYEKDLLENPSGEDNGNNKLDELLLSLLEEEETDANPTETDDKSQEMSTDSIINNPGDDFWGSMLLHYSASDSVDTLVFVKCLTGSDAIVELYDKSESGYFEQLLSCKAYIGLNGYSMPGNRVEGDGTVPCGDFGVTHAMGIKDAPATSMNYLKFTDDLYWSDNPYVCYNQLVSINDYPNVTGEHLAGIFPEYNYVLALDFNPECTPGVGSAIFFHCMGAKTYTGGCVAVSEENMLTVMKYFDASDRVIIFPENY